MIKKLITLTEEQYAKAEEIMVKTRIKSFSEFVRYLILSYERHEAEATASR